MCQRSCGAHTADVNCTVIRVHHGAGCLSTMKPWRTTIVLSKCALESSRVFCGLLNPRAEEDSLCRVCPQQTHGRACLRTAKQGRWSAQLLTHLRCRAQGPFGFFRHHLERLHSRFPDKLDGRGNLVSSQPPLQTPDRTKGSRGTAAPKAVAPATAAEDGPLHPSAG